MPVKLPCVLDATYSKPTDTIPYTDRKLPALSGEVHTTVQIASPLGQYNPADLTVLEMPVLGKHAVSYGKPTGRIMM